MATRTHSHPHTVNHYIEMLSNVVRDHQPQTQCDQGMRDISLAQFLPQTLSNEHYLYARQMQNINHAPISVSTASSNFSDDCHYRGVNVGRYSNICGGHRQLSQAWSQSYS